MKECSKCKTEKPLVNFSKRSSSKDGLHKWCKICVKKYNKKYYKNNPDKFTSIPSLSITNPERYKQIQKQWRYAIKGVYGIFENGKCLYVGESKRLRDRLIDHKRFIKNPHSAQEWRVEFYLRLSQHSNYVMGILEETENHKEKEKYYINKLKPLYNG